MEPLFGILLAAAVATWVYSDARARQAPHAVLWGVGTFLLLIVVLPAWLLLRPSRPDALEARKRCPYCAGEIQAAAAVCQHCGRNLDGSRTA